VQREIYQRDSIIVALNGLADSKDIILLSDVDEIPNPNSLTDIVSRFDAKKIYHFEQLWFIYYLNNLCNRRWFGTRAFSYGLLDGKSLDQMRFPTEDSRLFKDQVINNAGWHFSYLGGVENIRVKLDSLANQGRRATITMFLNRIFPSRIQKMLLANKDILLQGKRFSRVKIDHSYPVYLRTNLKKYKDWIVDDHH
jgi:beta-1,4-mannosyl-glycoprotein beta-1,4-N-acetylglucosaminyltransferase